MTPHTWTKEEIDGGPMGVGEFWKCSTCGASGGPTDWGKVGLLSEETEPSWRPFLAGTGVKLSRACCVESQAIIWLYIEEKLERLATLGPKGISPKYAALLKGALLRSPDVLDVTSVAHLVQDVELSHSTSRPTLAEVATLLEAAGFTLPETSAR
jgi:hypothetical protein